jgi:hypothetical protein
MKYKDVNDGVPIETTLASNVEETVDVEVVRIAAKKRSDSCGFTSVNSCRDGSSHDAERDERRCDFSMCLSCHVIYSYFVDFVNFGCQAQKSQLFEPT